MNTKRHADCQLRNDWKERIIRIGDEQTSLQNQFDNLRNDFSDNSPRIAALETNVNALDGRVIIAESDIADAENRISACENDIDRIDAELVDKTGDINALANRVSLAEADIDSIDARVSGIETGEILLSQLVPDADKNMAGKTLSNVIIKPTQIQNPKPGKRVIDIDPETGNVFYSINDYSHGIYYPIDGKTPKGGDACKPLVNGFELTGGVRFRQYGTNDTNGFVWERSSNETALMALGGSTGNLWVKGGLEANIATLNGIVITDGGTVDGVDISTHTHDGTAVGGAKINLANVEVTADKNINGRSLTNCHVIHANAYRLHTNGVNRWIIEKQGTEGGSDTGADMAILARADDGGPKFTSVIIKRDSSEIGVRKTVYPIVDTDADLGKPTNKFRDLHLSRDIVVGGATINAAKAAEWDGKARPPAYKRYYNPNLTTPTTEYLEPSAGRTAFIPMHVNAQTLGGNGDISISAIFDDSSELVLVQAIGSEQNQFLDAGEIAQILGASNKSGRTITRFKIRQGTSGVGVAIIDTYEY